MTVQAAHSAPAPALGLLAEAVMALAAAPDLASLAYTLARCLADLTGADSATVWLVDAAAGNELRLAGQWPATDPALAADTPLDLMAAPLARAALARGRAMPTDSAGGPWEATLQGRPDAALWLVPLLAGSQRLGIVYLAGVSRVTSREQLAQALTIVAAQAAVGVQALTARAAAHQESAEFLAIAAHDLKNTVTSVKGYTQLARRHLPADAAPRAHKWIGVVEQQIGTLCEALCGLVDFGRLQSGQLALEREAVDLRQVVEAATGRFADRPDGPRFDLSLPTAPVMGDWDPGRLSRAITAMLESAGRAAADGGTVQGTLSVDGDDAELRLGAPGLDERWPERGEWSRGADMGLYLARGFGEAHGGALGYRRTAAGDPLLRLILPVGPAPRS